MKTFHVLYHMARADFLERVRRYSFLLTLGFAGLLASGVYRGEIVLALGKYRGAYNSAWFGAFLALVATTFLSLIGFYIVKNSVQRDEQTRVGRILAATPLSKFEYTLGKTMSNFAVLASMVFVLALGAALLQLLRGSSSIDWWQLFSPFLLIALPTVAAIAAVAVLFETIPRLRGGFGNVTYFFVFTGLLAVSITLKSVDFTGISMYMQSMGDVLRKLDPSYRDSFTLQIGTEQTATEVFQWDGLHWSSSMVLQRLFWVGVALAIVYMASLLHHRFDPAMESQKSKTKKKIAADPAEEKTESSVFSRAFAHLTALTSFGGRPFIGLVLAELRLMLKGVSRWWYLVAFGFWIASLATPLEISRGMLTAVWIWPLLLWSKMGVRESIHQTSPIIFSSAHSLQRQFPAAWLAGVIVALATGSGVALRLLLVADLNGIAASLAGALFIPTLALALGVWSGTSKTFEAVYTFWWYVGPGHHIPYIDFMGTAAGSGRPTFYFAVVAVLVLITFARRRAQLAYA